MGAPSIMNTWIALLRTQQAMDLVARKSMDDVGLGFSDFVMLEALLHIGPQTPSQLAEKLRLTRGSVTSAIDRLGARGLVERMSHDRDARSCMVRLTKAGSKVIKPAWKAHKKDIEQVVGTVLTFAQRKALFQMLNAIRHAANKNIEGR